MPNRTVNHNNRNRAAYQVDGNTVRRMEAMPDYRKERRDRQEREREEELRNADVPQPEIRQKRFA